MNRFKDKSSRIIKHRLFFPLVAFALVLIVNVIQKPDFFRVSIANGVLYGYIIDVINRGSELVILAVGMTLVVAVSGGTDISVGSVGAVSGAIVCQILSGGAVSTKEFQNPYLLAILVALAVSAFCGAWNGFLVAKLHIQPMVATLILFTAGRGVAQLITNGQITYIRVEQYKYLGSTFPKVPVPTPIFIALIVVLCTYFVLKKTALGLYIQTVGINQKASRLVGLNPTKIKFIAYVTCGFMAGVAGIVASSRIYSADANNIGLNTELDAILAVALGGNSLSGGKFSLLGSVIGAYTIQALTTTLYSMSVSSDQLPVYKAIVVIIIVSLQSPEFMRWVRSFRGKFSGKRVAE